ncbi:MAG: TonB-dependent receptor [Gammaproteobacteria bacterium]
MIRINVKVAREIRRIMAASAVVAGLGAPVYAQDQSDEIATVVVTGSHIARTDEGALPVQVITQAQIEQTGATSAEQFLKTVSAAVQGNSNVVAASTAGVNAGGVSSVSLRGLGSQRTLVLVNGRRLSGGGTITDSTSVDINSIPLAALKEVQVLKEGASAVYGSDAIAGVINFLIRDDFEGATLSVYGGDTDDGGAIKRANGAIGFGNLESDRYNVMLSASWQKEDMLFGRDRSFARSGINVGANNDTTSGNSFPANLLVPGVDGITNVRNPALPGSSGTTLNPDAPNDCSPSVVSPLYGDDRCRYDPSPNVSLIPDAERISVFGAAHYAITDNVQLYGELSYSHNKQNTIIQPSPISDQFNLPEGHPLFNQAPYNTGVGLGGAPSPFAFATIVLKPASAYYPTAAVQAITGDGSTPDLLVRYRAVDSGNRDFTDVAKQPRGVLGIKGKAADWDFDAGFLYSETKLIESYDNGAPLYSKILPLLNSGTVNFFGPNTPDVEAQIRAANFLGEAYSTRTSIESFSANASRDVAKLPAGPLAIALGAEWRKEKFSTDPSEAMQIGDISTYGGNQLPMSRSRDAKALMGEVNIPLIEKKMEAGLAVRWDDYQNVGSKTTPQARIRWQPVEQLLLRASYGKGFRAPSLTELYQPQTLGVTAPGLNDPARCATTGNSNDCGTQFNILIGGTPTLKPETSDNYTLGVVFEPMRTASAGFDAFRVKLKNPIIFGIDPQSLLNFESQFPGFITRGAPTPSDCAGCPGPVQQIDQLNLNLGATNVDGVDADLRYRLPTGHAGTFVFGLVGTYFSKYEIQQPDGSFLSIVGRVSPIVNGAGGVIPRWHHYASVGWESGSWEATISQNYQSHYHDVAGTFEDATDPAYKAREVASYQTFDVQAAYSGIEHLKIALGLKNAFDQDPPYTNAGGQSYFQAGYDPGYADPRGRFLYGTVSYSFK